MRLQEAATPPAPTSELSRKSAGEEGLSNALFRSFSLKSPADPVPPAPTKTAEEGSANPRPGLGVYAPAESRHKQLSAHFREGKVSNLLKESGFDDVTNTEESSLYIFEHKHA